VTDDLVRQLQERAARALPAEEVERLGGWWLRHAPSCSWWVGSVLPHGSVVDSRISAAERFCSARGVPPRFQVTPGACAPGLEAALAARGYRAHGSLSLRIARSAAVVRSRPVGLKIQVDAQPTRSWFETWHAVSGTDPGAEWALLGRVRGPAAYASALAGDEVVAVGRAVVDTGWAGVFGMATLPAARGQGAGRAVLSALAEWAALSGAEQMYLQVERDNPAALRLYESAGFRELRAYHYRVASGR
jgi:GNAT superfamily N-acetyltransferase